MTYDRLYAQTPALFWTGVKSRENY